MRGRAALAGALAFLLPTLTACNDDGGGIASAGSKAVSAAAGSVPSLVNVDLSNVLNDLAVRLNLDRANVPVNAQIPITLALNVCGVSINVLSVSGGGQAKCSATTSSPELAQVVQQQIAAGGSVGGGAQGGSTAGTSGSTASGAGTTSGAQDSSATSTGGSTSTGTGTGATGTSQQPTNPQ